MTRNRIIRELRTAEQIAETRRHSPLVQDVMRRVSPREVETMDAAAREEIKRLVFELINRRTAR